jgi:transposase
VVVASASKLRLIDENPRKSDRVDVEYLARKAQPELPDNLPSALEPVLPSIQDLSERIRSYDQEIGRLCEAACPETQALRSIKGVGALTILASVLTLADPQRFRKNREVGPCLGLTP